MVFKWPIMLAGLALIPILGVAYYFAQKRRRKYVVRFTNLDLLAQVIGPGPGIRRHIPPAIYMLGAAALLASLARPQAVIQVPRDQAAIILAIDVSGSMTAQDLLPTRLEASRQAANIFIQNLPKDVQAGLVSFQESASARVSLTREHDQITDGINRLQANGGTALGEAIYLSLDLLSNRAVDKDGSQGPALIVLITDGESNKGRSPRSAAEIASQSNIPIYTIGIGKRNQTAYLNSGQAVTLDEETLQEIAYITGGQYFYAAENQDLNEIYRNLSRQTAWEEETTEVTVFASALGTLLILIGGFLSLRWFQQIP